ncbi:MAG: hypothetical protein ABI895_01475 [Deltaproteobacteria bacterium]
MDDWSKFSDSEAVDTHIGVSAADLPTADLPVGAAISFTFFWLEAGSKDPSKFVVLASRPAAGNTRRGCAGQPHPLWSG